MDVIAVYSESGGVTKTTTAVSLGTVMALAGRSIVLVDLDPRAAASQWLGIEPKQSGWHSGAILASDDAPEWVTDLPVESSWTPNLRVIPSSRRLSTREEGGDNDNDLRLRRGLAPLAGVGVDYVILDMPNRQGGPITRAALNATDRVVYASTLSPDGVSGVEGARVSVHRFKAARREIGAPEQITEVGVIAGAWRSPNIPSRIDKAGIERLEELGLLRPIVPHRTIVQESRATGAWYGRYDRGRPVAEAYEALAMEVTR